MSLKQCPVCKTACPLDAQVCPKCGHKFRTVFDPQGQPQAAPQPAQAPVQPPIQTPAPQQMPQPGYAPQLEQHGRRPLQPLAKWLIGFAAAGVLGFILLAFLASRKPHNPDLVGEWKCMTPNPNVSSVIYYADGKGDSDGENGHKKFLWEGGDDRILITPISPNLVSGEMEEGGPHWTTSTLSADKQHMTLVADPEPDKTYEFIRVASAGNP